MALTMTRTRTQTTLTKLAEKLAATHGELAYLVQLLSADDELQSAHRASVLRRQLELKALRDSLLRIKKYLGDPAYNFIVHTSPINGHEREDYHWHIELVPRVTPIAGFEWGTGFFINSTSPEETTQFLRDADIS